MTRDKLIKANAGLNYLWGMTNMLMKAHGCTDDEMKDINDMFSEIEDYLMESEEDD